MSNNKLFNQLINIEYHFLMQLNHPVPYSLEIAGSSSVQNSREQRLANFITLKNLENQIPKELFEQIVA